MSIKVALVDDHRVIRDGVRLMLATEPDIEIIGEAATGQEFIDLLEASPIDVAVVDVRMPTMNGFEVLEAVRDRFPDTRVVILTMYDDPAYVRRAIELGASAYLLKVASKDEILEAIRAVAEGKAYLQGELTRGFVAALVGHDDSPSIDREDLTLLELLAQGASNAEIAERLDRSEGQVRRSLHDLFERLGARSRAQAVAEAFRRGYLM